MKNILSSFLFFCGLLIVMLPACKKDEDKVTTNGGTADTLSTTTTVLTLTKDQAADTVITFNWTPADFGYSAAVTYTLQLDVQGNDFSNAKEVTMPIDAFSKSYTGVDFNALLLSLNLTTGADTIVEARIKSEISTSVAPVYSNVVSLTVNPYPLVSYIYVPGAYQNWDPTTADSLKSPTSNNIYTGIIKFTGSDLAFKITTGKNWDVAYGSSGEGALSTSGGNITAPAAGSYMLTVDLNANTIAFKPTLWSIVGDATPGGWDIDTDMSFNNGTQTWSVIVPLTAGSVKFRLNHTWDTNYGGSGGVLALNGSDITVSEAGTYLVTFDLNAGTYSLVKQ